MLWNVAIFFSCFVGLAMNNKLGGVLKWLLAFVLFVSLVSWGGVYSDKINEMVKLHGLSGVSLLMYRSLPSVAWLLAFVLSFYVLRMTSTGSAVWTFFRNARLEMYRVVWPTKQEIGQTTLMVVVFVCVVALFLWGVDSLFAWVVTKITGLA